MKISTLCNHHDPSYQFGLVPCLTYTNVMKFLSELSTWGRKMGKKLEILRRSESKDSLNSNNSRESVSRKISWKLVRSPSNSSQLKINDLKQDSEKSSLKNFFHRIGSTGLLCHPEKVRKSEPSMYRSLSTSQLSMSSYIKGEDPADYIADTEGDTSCSYEENLHTIPAAQTNYIPMKTVSCDNITAMDSKVESTLTPASRKSSFPYAFLRSKLSVLPEENGGSVLKNFNLSVSQYKHTRSPSLCCKFEYKRSSSYVSSNESGYDSDSARVSEKSEITDSSTHNSSMCSDGDNASLVAQSTSDNNDNDSDFVDSIADFEFDKMDTCKLLDLPGMHVFDNRLESRTNDLTCNASDYSKILNTPSMNLFYKKNEYLKNKQEDTANKPKFTRHMFIKNSTRRELCRYMKNNISKSYEQDLSSLPSSVNESETQHRYKLIRLIKNSTNEDLGIYLTMKIHHLPAKNSDNVNHQESKEARYVIIKLEPGKTAERYVIINLIKTFTSDSSS